MRIRWACSRNFSRRARAHAALCAGLATATAATSAQAQTTTPAPAGVAAPPAAQTVEPSAQAPNPSAAESVQYVVEAGSVVAVRDGARTPLAIPPPVLAVHRSGTTLYVARGASGVAVYELAEPTAPKLLRTLSVPGSANDFHVAGGELWVVTVTKSAVPLTAIQVESAPSPAPPTAAPPASPATPSAPGVSAPPSTIALRRVAPGTVELAAGAKQNIRVGDKFALFHATELSAEGTDGFRGEELVGVAVVVAVKEDSALAELGRGSVVGPSDRARRAKGDEEESNAFPPRVPGLGEASVVLRPLVKVGRPLGLGLLAHLEASYWGNAWFAGVRVDPLGLGGTADGSIVATTALVEGGYDGRAFSVGLGVGLSWTNGDLDHMLDFGSSDAASEGPRGPIERVERQETHAAFTLGQVARLGARDGLNLSVHNHLLLHSSSDSGDDDESGFIYGGTAGRLAIPTGRRADFFLEGGGGLMGYWFAGVGVATWLHGNGSPGSWRLSVSAGGAGISGSREVSETYTDWQNQPYTSEYTETVAINGPMVSLGIARRFGF